MVDAVGDGVDRARGRPAGLAGARPARRPYGTAAEFTVQPAERVVPLPDDASFDLGASLGVPAVTAHRALTASEGGPSRLGAGSPGRAHRAGRRRCRRGRQRRDPAGPVGRGHGRHHGEQRREGGAGHRRRRAPHGELPRASDAERGDPRDRAGRRRHRGRGGAGAEQRARPGGGRRSAGTIAIYANNGGDQFTVDAAGDVLAEPALPVRAALHARPGPRRRGRRGRQRGGGGRGAAGGRGRRASRCTTTRSRRPPPRTTRSSTARSARCCSTWPSDTDA